MKTITMVMLMILFCLRGTAFSQDMDSLRTDESIRSKWAGKPPDGKSEKTQGIIISAIGVSSVISGIILLNEKDPCDDISSSNTICTSNVDQVRGIGAATAAIGVGGFIFGIVRYSQGVKKARVYEEWKRKNFSLIPQLKYNGRSGFEVGVSIGF